MCIGIPMKVIEAHEGRAVCEGMGARKEIDMSLVGDVAEGAFVLVFLDAAREVISAEHARAVEDALSALNVALSGGDASAIDALFPDLANREPELPEFLKDQIKAEAAE